MAKMTKGQKDAFFSSIRADFEKNKLEVLRRVADPTKRILFEEVFKRSVNITDPLFVSNRGRYYELFAGILLGELQTIEDVKGFDVTDTLPHTMGPDITSSTGIPFQVKGPNASIKVDASLITLRNGVPTKSSMRKVLENYYRTGNRGRGLRFAFFIGTSYFDTMLDVGHKTFEDFAVETGLGFSFEETNEVVKVMRRSLKSQKINTNKKILKYLEDGRKMISKGGADFDLLAMIAQVQNKSKVVSTIDDMIEQLKKDTWSVRFNPRQAGFAETMVNQYGAVVRTSIQRYESHDPFYKILGSLGSSREKYLSGKGKYNARTLGNKSKDYFYDKMYENFDY